MATALHGGYQRIAADLEEQLGLAADDLRRMAGSRIFITGGTGFVGRWMLESLLHADARLDLRLRLVVLTRNPTAFTELAPHLAQHAGVTLVSGDVREMPANIGAVDGVVHAATPASAALNRDAPFAMLDTIVEGGRTVLDFAAQSGEIPVLFTSSGAVYGAQPPEQSHTSEEFQGGPDCLQARNTYAEGKRVGELQCAIYEKTHRLQPKIARLFAFVGPYQPLDIHFAVANFIGDVLAQRPIILTGDGTTVRSYQYAAEMVTWLWAIYARGETLRPYNVGNEEAVSTGELAHLIATYGAPAPTVEIRGQAKPDSQVDRYVPSTRRIRDELGVRQTVNLRDALARTFAYHRGAGV